MMASGVNLRREETVGKYTDLTFDMDKWPLSSYYDKLVEKRFLADESRKNLLHRMVITSKLRDGGDINELGNYYERLLKNLLNKYQAEAATGLLLIYPRHCVHVLESSTEMLVDVVRDAVASAENEIEGPVQASRILVVSHDIPQRLYQQWSFRVLDIQASSTSYYEPSESTDAVVMETLIQLLKLGSYLAKQPKLNLKNAMDSLHEKVPELLPQQDVIGFLVDCDDKCIINPQDYIDKYEKPFDVVLERELIWPVPSGILPYN